MPHDETTAEESAGVESRHRDVSKESLKWHPWRLIHWFIFGGGVVYTIWSLSVSIESEFIVSDVPEAFTPSLYGFQRKQDNMQFGWTITRSYLRDSLKWLLLHPILGRATAYAAPSLVPVFHSVYSLLAVASVFSWEVAVLFLCEHALFYGITALRNPALSYIITLFILGQNYIFTSPNLGYFSRKHGPLCYMVTYVAFYWNIARCLSFSVDFLKAERLKPEESRCRWPPYWKTLAYVIYVPTVYLGPLQNYDDYVGQVDKDRPACTPQEIACSIARFLRCGAHFALMEAMTHFIYSGTMARFPWLIEELDNTCICGFVMATHFFFYVRYLFTYGFAGALASAEGIEIPPPAKCVGRMSKASQFWRYLDRGMHLYIRRYFYKPVQGNRKTPGWIVIGTAAAFSFTWCWHGMRKGDGIWCFVCVVCLSFEALVTEVRKLGFIKSFEVRYLGTPNRMREAAAVLGSPQYLLTIIACLFHLVDVEVSFTVCKRALFGPPGKPRWRIRGNVSLICQPHNKGGSIRAGHRDGPVYILRRLSKDESVKETFRALPAS